MNLRLLSILLLVPFLLLSAFALADVGYVGIIAYQLNGLAGYQVLADLAISLILLLTFLVPHARSGSVNPWPWVVGTCVVGVIAPLAYFALYGAFQAE